MLGRKEIEYWVTRKVVDPYLHAHQHYRPEFGRGGTFDSFDTFDTYPPASDPRPPDDDARLIANAHRVLTLFRSGECHDTDTAQLSPVTGSFERELVWIQRDMKTNSDSKPSVPWESSKLIFPVSGELSGNSIISATIDSNACYAVLSGTRLRVVRVPLDGGQPALLWEAPYQGSLHYGFGVTIPAIGEQKVFVGTDRGIFVFPLAGGTAQHITTAEGLPTDHVSSLAWLDGKLYAGLGGGYLIAYELKTGECQVLASSRRREAKNGLDNLSPTPGIEFMMPDSDRHRVLFTVSLGTPCAPQLGLWQIDVTTGQVTQLVRLYSPPWWTGLIGDGTLLIRVYGDAGPCGGSNDGIVSYELATGRTRLLSDFGEKKPAGPQIPVPEGIVRLPWVALPPHAMIDGWLWFANGRVSTNAAGLEYFPTSEETQGAIPNAWKSFHLLRDRGQMAIVGPKGIWLLTLKPHETSENASKVSP
jgi:hypothetical protein